MSSILETAFGVEKVHGHNSLPSVLARPRMSKPYLSPTPRKPYLSPTPRAKLMQEKTTNTPPPRTQKGAKTLSNPHQCPIPLRGGGGGGVGVSIDRCINHDYSSKAKYLLSNNSGDEGKLSALNFTARRRRKILTLWKYCDFGHEKFAFLCANGIALEKWPKGTKR